VTENGLKRVELGVGDCIQGIDAEWDNHE
jgi:hypothetical protein